MSNAINWFEIPVRDLETSARFYETVLADQDGKPRAMRREVDGGRPMAIFAYDQGAGAVGGALVADPKLRPGKGDTILYLDVTGRLDQSLLRVAAAGGAIVQPKTDISVNGFIALVKDPDGNVVGLHSHRV